MIRDVTIRFNPFAFIHLFIHLFMRAITL